MSQLFLDTGNQVFPEPVTAISAKIISTKPILGLDEDRVDEDLVHEDNIDEENFIEDFSMKIHLDEDTFDEDNFDEDPSTKIISTKIMSTKIISMKTIRTSTKTILMKTIFGLDEGHFSKYNLEEDNSWTRRRPFRRREMSTKPILGLDEDCVDEDLVHEDNIDEDNFVEDPLMKIISTKTIRPSTKTILKF